jgi:hypothetical protein
MPRAALEVVPEAETGTATEIGARIVELVGVRVPPAPEPDTTLVREVETMEHVDDPATTYRQHPGRPSQ